MPEVPETPETPETPARHAISANNFDLAAGFNFERFNINCSDDFNFDRFNINISLHYTVNYSFDDFLIDCLLIEFPVRFPFSYSFDEDHVKTQFIRYVSAYFKSFLRSGLSEILVKDLLNLDSSNRFVSAFMKLSDESIHEDADKIVLAGQAPQRQPATHRGSRAVTRTAALQVLQHHPEQAARQVHQLAEQEITSASTCMRWTAT